jgi:hypothetical protein
MLRKIVMAGALLWSSMGLVHGQALPSDLPNITINAERLQASVVFRTARFKATDCAIAEGCVGGPGKRNLMRFDVETPNKGDADLYLGDPRFNSAFHFSPCHGHYHLEGYAVYDLLDQAGTVIVAGHKQAFCLVDLLQWDPTAGPAKYTCADQGISAGWSDVYASYLDCQWIDVTGVPPGRYVLRVTINGGENGDHAFAESDYRDNVATVPVTIPKRFQ